LQASFEAAELPKAVKSVTSVVGKFETGLERRPPVAIRYWWISAFLISFLICLSTLLFLGEDAYAKSAGKAPEGAVGVGGGGHNGGDKGGAGAGGHKGGSGSSPVKEAANAVGGGAQRGDQALKDAPDSAGGADRAVGQGDRPASGVAGPWASKNIDEPSRITEPVVDNGSEITRPLLKESGSLVDPVNHVAEPVVKTARRTIEPVGAAVSPLIEPVAETTMPLVKPVKKVAAPVIEPVGEIVGTVAEPVKEVAAPVVDPLDEIAGPLVSPVGEMVTTPLTAPVDTGIAAPAVEEPELSEPLVGPSSVGQFVEAVTPAVIMPVDEAANVALLPSEEPVGTVSSKSVVLHSELASAVQGNPEGSSDASAGGLASTAKEAYSPKAAETLGIVSKALISGFPTALQQEGAISSIEDIVPIQIPQLLGAAGAAAGSLSSGSSSGGGGTAFGILTLMIVSLLGGKFLWSARDFLKPDTTLLLTIERPG
jgi:hypothetical protein